MDSIPSQGLSQASKKHLVKRLYRNSSLGRLHNRQTLSIISSPKHQTSSLLFTQNNHNRSNILVPSISLRKLKSIDLSQKSMQFSQGKILITRLPQDSILEQQNHPTMRKMFKKLPKLATDKRILPQQLTAFKQIQEDQNYPSVNQGTQQKTEKFLKGLKNKTGDTIDSLEELTPNDFIKLIQQDTSITNQFCYLKKMSHPYDLRIVQFNTNEEPDNNKQNLAKGKLNQPFKKTHIISHMVLPDEYITISKRGVTYFGKQQSRFVTIEEWKKQAYFFNKLMNLDFFKKYNVYKNFTKWKKYVKKSKMQETINQLKDKILLSDKFLRNALIETRKLCSKLQNEVSYCKLDDLENTMPMPYSKFKKYQEIFIQTQFDRRIKSTQYEIKQNIKVQISHSLQDFKENMKITPKQGKGEPLLIGDEKNLQMNYTKQATLKTQQQRFRKFLKLIDLIIMHSKVNMMQESTQAITRKISQQNQLYLKQCVESNYKTTFKGKQYLQCFLNLDMVSERIVLSPTSEQIKFLFEHLVKNSINQLCRNHRKILEDQDMLYTIYQHVQTTQKDNDRDFLRLVLTSDERQEKMSHKIVRQILSSYKFIDNYSKKFTYLVKIYFKNTRQLQLISQYQSADHDVISQLLESWRKQLIDISNQPQQHDAAMFLLNSSEFKNMVKNITNQCLQKMKKRLPFIFQQNAQRLRLSLKQSISKIQTKPISIESYMIFQTDLKQIYDTIEELAQQKAYIQSILIIMKKTAVSNSQLAQMKKYEKDINDIQSNLTHLRSKIDQAQSNENLMKNRAKEQIKVILPKFRQYTYRLYSQITTKNNEMQIPVIGNFIDKISNQFEEIEKQYETIQQYQGILGMEKQTEYAIDSFKLFLNNYIQIWSLRKQLEQSKQKLLETIWWKVEVEIYQKFLENVQKKSQELKFVVDSKAQDQQFKLSTEDITNLTYILQGCRQLKPFIQAIQCLKDKSLGLISIIKMFTDSNMQNKQQLKQKQRDKQWKQLKLYFESINKKQINQEIFVPDSKVTVNRMIELNLIQHLHFFKKIMLKSRKQIQCSTKINIMNKFWGQGNSLFNAKCLMENFQESYEAILIQIDEKMAIINNIYQDDQAQELKNRIAKDKLLFEALKSLLSQWHQHQVFLKILQPIFTNNYWKSTKQFKLYTHADNTWKKIMKTYKEFSLKKLAQNENKILPLFRDNNAIFHQLSRSVGQFLKTKRQAFPKFWLINDEDLLQILSEQIRDFRSLEKLLIKIFPCVFKFQFEQDLATLPASIVNIDKEVLPLKFRTNNSNNMQIQELCKILQQCIKHNIKVSLRQCLAVYEKDKFDRKQWLNENLIQTILFIDKAQFTKIIEYDYLVQEGGDISQLLDFQISQIKELKSFILESPNKLQTLKYQLLLLQQIYHRQVIEDLHRKEIKTESDFQWQKQIRYYCSSTAQGPYIRYFMHDIMYGCEFLAPRNCIHISTKLQKFFLSIINSLSLYHNPILQHGHSYILQALSYNSAKNFHEVYCDSYMTKQYLLNCCIGAYATGSYILFNQVDYLVEDTFKIVSQFIKQVRFTILQQNKQKKMQRDTLQKQNMISTVLGNKLLNLNREAGICFTLSKLRSQHNNGELMIKSKCQYRMIQFMEPNSTVYIDTVLSIYGLEDAQTSRRLSKALKVISQVYNCGRNCISTNQIQEIVKKALYSDHNKLCTILNTNTLYNNGNEQAKKKVLQNILNEILRNIQQNIFQQQCRVFCKNIFKEIVFKQKVQNQLQNKKKYLTVYDPKKMLESSMSYYNLIIILGNSFNRSLTIRKCHQNSQYDSIKLYHFNTNLINSNQLFGAYNSLGLWQRGIISEIISNKVKQQQSKWIVIEGQFSSQTYSLAENIMKNKKLSFPNGHILEIPQNIKFIFSVKVLKQISEDELNYFPTIKLAANKNYEETITSLFELQVKPDFSIQAEQAYQLLLNFSINNIEKVIHSLKILGYKDQYLSPNNILQYFVSIIRKVNLKFFYNRDQQFFEKNTKIIEKIFIWALYWSIGTSLPSSAASKFHKILLEQIKVEIDPSENLGQLVLAEIENQKTIDFIKFKESALAWSQQVFVLSPALKAQINIFSSIFEDAIVFTGQVGKSAILQQIKHSLSKQLYSFLTIPINRQSCVEQLKNILLNNLTIQILPSNNNSNTIKYCLSTINNKKLVILIDNINLLTNNLKVQEFLTQCIRKKVIHLDKETMFKHGIYSQDKIYLKNVMFVFAQTNAYESSLCPQFTQTIKPLYMNGFEIQQIKFPLLEHYKQKKGQLHEMLPVIYDSTQSLYHFASALRQQLTGLKPLQVSLFINMFHDISFSASLTEDIAKLWLYFAQLHYLHSGVCIGVQDKIYNEIRNIYSILPKKNEPYDILSGCGLSSNDYIKQLLEKFPYLINFSTKERQYLIALKVIINRIANSSGVSSNILTLYQKRQPSIKAELLKSISGLAVIDLHKQLKDRIRQEATQQKKIFYISDNIEKTKFMKIIDEISQFCQENTYPSNIIFMIDISNKDVYSQLIQKTPYIANYFKTYKKLVEQNCYSQFAAKQVQILKCNYSFENQQKSFVIQKCLLNSQAIKSVFEPQLMKTIKRLASLNAKTKCIIEKLQQFKAENQNKITEIAQLVKIQECKIQEKKIKSDQLQKLSKDIEQAIQKKQQLEKHKDKLNQENIIIQNQLKNIKSKKANVSQEQLKLQQVMQSLESFIESGKSLFEEYLKQAQTLDSIQQQKQKIVFLFSLLYTSYEMECYYQLDTYLQCHIKILMTTLDLIFNIKLQDADFKNALDFIKGIKAIIFILFAPKPLLLQCQDETMVNYLNKILSKYEIKDHRKQTQSFMVEQPEANEQNNVINVYNCSQNWAFIDKNQQQQQKSQNKHKKIIEISQNSIIIMANVKNVEIYSSIPSNKILCSFENCKLFKSKSFLQIPQSFQLSICKDKIIQRTIPVHQFKQNKILTADLANNHKQLLKISDRIQQKLINCSKIDEQKFDKKIIENINSIKNQCNIFKYMIEKINLLASKCQQFNNNINIKLLEYLKWVQHLYQAVKKIELENGKIQFQRITIEKISSIALNCIKENYSSIKSEISIKNKCEDEMQENKNSQNEIKTPQQDLKLPLSNDQTIRGIKKTRKQSTVFATNAINIQDMDLQQSVCNLLSYLCKYLILQAKNKEKKTIFVQFIINALRFSLQNCSQILFKEQIGYERKAVIEIINLVSNYLLPKYKSNRNQNDTNNGKQAIKTFMSKFCVKDIEEDGKILVNYSYEDLHQRQLHTLNQLFKKDAKVLNQVAKSQKSFTEEEKKQDQILLEILITQLLQLQARPLSLVQQLISVGEKFMKIKYGRIILQNIQDWYQFSKQYPYGESIFFICEQEVKNSYQTLGKIFADQNYKHYLVNFDRNSISLIQNSSKQFQEHISDIQFDLILELVEKSKNDGTVLILIDCYKQDLLRKLSVYLKAQNSDKILEQQSQLKVLFFYTSYEQWKKKTSSFIWENKQLPLFEFICDNNKIFLSEEQNSMCDTLNQIFEGFSLNRRERGSKNAYITPRNQIINRFIQRQQKPTSKYLGANPDLYKIRKAMACEFANNYFRISISRALKRYKNKDLCYKNQLDYFNNIKYAQAFMQSLCQHKITYNEPIQQQDSNILIATTQSVKKFKFRRESSQFSQRKPTIQKNSYVRRLSKTQIHKSRPEQSQTQMNFNLQLAAIKNQLKACFEYIFTSSKTVDASVNFTKPFEQKHTRMFTKSLKRMIGLKYGALLHEIIGQNIDDSVCGQFITASWGRDEDYLQIKNWNTISEIIQQSGLDEYITKEQIRIIAKERLNQPNNCSLLELIDKKRILKQIDNVLNNLPLISYNLKQITNAKYYQKLLENEISICLEIVKYISNTLHKMKNIIDSKVIYNSSMKEQLLLASEGKINLSYSNINNLNNLSFVNEKHQNIFSMDKLLKFLQKKVQYLDSLIKTNKQNQNHKQSLITFKSSYLFAPIQFLNAYLYTQNILNQAKIDLSQCRIVIKHFSEKQRQTIFMPMVEHQGLVILSINNLQCLQCLYDTNKCVLIDNQKAKQETKTESVHHCCSKIIPNSYIYFSESTVNEVCSYADFGGQRRLDLPIEIANKLKQDTLWKNKPTLCHKQVDWL